MPSEVDSHASRTGRKRTDTLNIESFLLLNLSLVQCMDFTEIYRQSSSLVSFSPGAHFILTASGDRVIVRQTDTFQITQTWVVDPTHNPTHDLLTSNKSSHAKSYFGTSSESGNSITHIGWSCDSEYILAASAKHGVVFLLKLRDKDWNGRIDAGTEGDLRCQRALYCLLNPFQVLCQQSGPQMVVRSSAFLNGV